MKNIHSKIIFLNNGYQLIKPLFLDKKGNNKTTHYNVDGFVKRQYVDRISKDWRNRQSNMSNDIHNVSEDE